jgi:hypothetical protein
MTGSRGAIVVNPLYTTEEMKISNPEVNVDRVIREFLRIGEAVAGKWIEMPNGVLFLQMPPENPADGAVYVYDRKQRLFYQIDFEGDEFMDPDEFEHLAAEYRLLRFAEQPALLQCLMENTATA